jgi:Ca2+-binding RTX toxin-like protein
VNDGIISGGRFGIHVRSGDGSLSIENQGTIEALDGYALFLGSEIDKVKNFGVISESIYLGLGNDTLVNRGSLSGDVLLSGGDDRFDGRWGTVDGNLFGGEGLDSFDLRSSSMEGKVNGGAGKDTFLPGAEDEVIDGGLDYDVLDFRGSAGLRVSLRDDSSTGRAEGDIYLNIEQILGSRGGADVLIGNEAINKLIGFGGDDIIFGHGGGDTLSGGLGADRLSGGYGDDIFNYSIAEEGGDVITGFRLSLGNNDSFRFSAAGFGGGLVAGAALPAAAFRTRTDNKAQDSNDRFIFNTVDRTLWFDVDGDPDNNPANATSGAAAVLIADIQDGAVVSSGDILLI